MALEVVEFFYSDSEIGKHTFFSLSVFTLADPTTQKELLENYLAIYRKYRKNRV